MTAQPDADTEMAPSIAHLCGKALTVAKTKCPSLKLEPAELIRAASENHIDIESLQKHGVDFAIATACGRGDEAAIAWFDHHIVSEAPAFLARFKLNHDQLEEVKQTVRIRLLSGQTPTVVKYHGKCPLRLWFRVVLVREAVSFLRAPQREIADEDALTALAFDGAGPEIDAMRVKYAPVFNECVRQSVTSLNDREKTLLRMHFVDGLNIDGIGAAYRVNRSTAARWLVAIRKDVMERVKERFHHQLGATSSEFVSLVNLVREDARLTLQRLLVDPVQHNSGGHGGGNRV